MMVVVNMMDGGGSRCYGGCYGGVLMAVIKGGDNDNGYRGGERERERERELTWGRRDDQHILSEEQIRTVEVVVVVIVGEYVEDVKKEKHCHDNHHHSGLFIPSLYI